MEYFRKNVNKMFDFNKMWKSFKRNNQPTRGLKDLNYSEINLNEYILIDVRSQREFQEEHLANAINIPLLDIKKKIKMHVKDKNKKLLIYCQSGIRSAKAVQILESLGYLQVYNLKGGLENI